MNNNENVMFDLTNDSLSKKDSELKTEQDINILNDTPQLSETHAIQLQQQPKCETIESRLAELHSMLNSLKITVASVIQEVKQIDKAYTKEKKKKQEREKDTTGTNNSGASGSSTDQNRKNKRPSGFARPVNITDELCVFMNIKEGTKVARTEVTRFLNKYITDNQLQNTQAKTKINADEPLKKLLRLNQEELTYFNLQKYMNQHFV